MTRIGSMCTGYGGLDIATQAMLGGTLAWVADPDPTAAAILTHHHPHVPNHGDIRTTDWPSVEPVDVLTAGFPCQPVSVAGRSGGTNDERWLFDDIAPTAPACAISAPHPRAPCVPAMSTGATGSRQRTPRVRSGSHGSPTSPSTTTRHK